MSKPTVSNIRKRIGRPPVNAVPVMVRIPPAEIEPIDAWIKALPKPKPSRPEAIRRLVEIGLAKSNTPKRPRVLSTAKEGATRAAELAAGVIGDQMPNTSDEEKATRRRRLIKGPSEFRNLRRDRPQ